MRSERTFLNRHRAAAVAADPAAEDLSAGTLRTVGLVDLCLHFLATRLPGERTDAVPVTLLGYPAVLDTLEDREVALRELAALRHLCSRFASYAAWLDALQRHAAAPQTVRCYDAVAGMPRRRLTASEGLLRCLTETLGSAVPWVARQVRPAEPGEYHVRTNHGDTLLSYTVPPLPVALPEPRQHRSTGRTINPPVVLPMEGMLRVAEDVDRAEAEDDWPSSLPPLGLAERLRKVAFHDPEGAVFRDGSLVLNGANHLVGMLSSGKSSLVWGVLFALTKGGGGRRVAVLASDTIQAAAMVARLQRHGVSATVLSSPYNREGHLGSIHWQQSLSDGGTLVSSAGDLTANFSVACPLDGMQTEPKVVRGRRSDVWFPSFREKPCHRLQPAGGDDDDTLDDDELPGRTKRSCPLWSRCPAQVQQRTAVDAQVVVMTPAAFVHMTPDRWVSGDLMTVPELMQFGFDVVLVDEVDGFQKTLDGIFSPRETLMGDERTVYAPSIAVRSSEALRLRSGAQFRHEVNTRWQKRFHEFFGLIGTLYAVLQNEGANLGGLVGEVPFTAGSILYELWRRGVLMRGGDPAAARDDGFLDVTRVAAVLTRMSRSGDADAADDLPGGPADPAFRAAADALAAVAARVVLDDYYEAALDQMEGDLDGPLGVFDVRVRGGVAKGVQRLALSRRENAAALLLAVVTDLVLQRYVWLIRAQPAVAGDFGIDDTQLLSQANNLVRHYRTLLPANPAGAAFGLSYEAPSGKADERKGGKLTLVNHLGVGRHLVVHLHDLLAAEGQAGPHVLMLSGTSWAGGRIRRLSGGERRSVASPVYDVQVPVKGVLVQPVTEVEAVGRSIFRLVGCQDDSGKQVRASGLDETGRRRSLRAMAVRLGTKRGDTNLIEDHWAEAERTWGAADIADRRRALLVTNSYADAAFVADALAEVLGREWSVRCLVRDSGDDPDVAGATGPRLAQPLPRSLVERFGVLPERSVLVAPLQVISRGHNILNDARRAAVSAIYFLHRPHPRPDDMAPVIGRLNRYAMERHLRGLSREGDGEDIPARMRRLRHAASSIVREGLDRRSGYAGLPPHHKAQFAWDLLTPLWQTIGRGIRNGCPVMVGFMDRQFAPRSFDRDGDDTGDSSVLVQIVDELRFAMRDRHEGEVAQRLYAPFLGALERTRDLRGTGA
ncbi:pPIWI_RE_Z domain-containing protein [Belnapia rosea]|uniref:pPIWI-RE three-gene island domain-containing protein n=1 Tax=Belnapia rosea TaxID=938405 RepID=A0A1G7C0W8_9PROT|nr:hypothetical protein [Belnapia rosea]SDE32336.1 hypothetical protein SAMN04487779_102823 [Belnapia rosea]